jgi:hypothetical protein
MAAKKQDPKELDAQLHAMLMAVGGTEEAEPAPAPVAPPPKPKSTGWGPKPK